MQTISSGRNRYLCRNMCMRRDVRNWLEIECFIFGFRAPELGGQKSSLAQLISCYCRKWMTLSNELEARDSFNWPLLTIHEWMNNSRRTSSTFYKRVSPVERKLKELREKWTSAMCHFAKFYYSQTPICHSFLSLSRHSFNLRLIQKLCAKVQCIRLPYQFNAHFSSMLTIWSEH